MSNGTYGIKRGADVGIEDMEVYLHFTPNRNTLTNTIQKLNTSEVVIPRRNPGGLQNEVMGGLYTIKLPKEIFNNKGIYTVFIRPLQIRAKISDVGVLSAQPNIRGIVFDINSIPSEYRSKFANNSLIGYRVEYLDASNTSDPKIRNTFRIITSNNRSEVVTQNFNNTTQKAVKYRFTDNGDLTFCTLTPSSPSASRPNVLPFMGEVGQDVILSNTYFDPIMFEVDLVEHDLNDVMIGMFGNRTKSLEDGIYTIYDFENEIYKQFTLYEIKDEFTDEPLFEVKEKNNTIDNSKNFDTITDIDG